MIDIRQKKEQILTFLRTNGPSLPVRIAKSIEMEPVFASAVLSEVLGEKRIRMSHMKIGTSSLYFLPGQEAQLEIFADSLKSAEKEAFLRIKDKKVLFDRDEEPVVRVALRNLKDFAIPFKHHDEIVWRYAFSDDDEIKHILMKNNSLAEPVKEKVEEEEKEEVKEEKELVKENIVEEKEVVEDEKEEEKVVSGKAEDIFDTVMDEEVSKHEFFGEVMDFLKRRKLEFLEEIQTDKKEVVGKVQVDSTLGPLTLLLVAKNKKSVTKDEITSTLQRATYSKMPVLLVMRKSPTKAIASFVENNHLIMIEVMD